MLKHRALPAFSQTLLGSVKHPLEVDFVAKEFFNGVGIAYCVLELGKAVVVVVDADADGPVLAHVAEICGVSAYSLPFRPYKPRVKGCGFLEEGDFCL